MKKNKIILLFAFTFLITQCTLIPFYKPIRENTLISISSDGDYQWEIDVLNLETNSIIKTGYFGMADCYEKTGHELAVQYGFRLTCIYDSNAFIIDLGFMNLDEAIQYSDRSTWVIPEERQFRTSATTGKSYYVRNPAGREFIIEVLSATYPRSDHVSIKYKEL